MLTYIEKQYSFYIVIYNTLKKRHATNYIYTFPRNQKYLLIELDFKEERAQ